MSTPVVEMTTDDNQSSAAKSINEVIYRCGGISCVFQNWLFFFNRRP